MHIIKKTHIFIYLFIYIILFNTVFADSFTSIARLSLVTGSVSLLPAGEDQWVDASLNRPLVLGDNLWIDTSAKAALEFGTTAIWLNSSTSLKILNLTDNIGQFQLAEGTIVLIANTIKPGQTYEIDTPNLALTITKAGYYRIDVKSEEEVSTTFVSVKIGLGEVYGQNTSAPLEIKEGSTCRYTGVELQNPVCTPLTSLDGFDNWVLLQEKHTLEAKNTSNYVSPSVLGYQDLESYGSWQADVNYGNIWVPEDVGSNWAPYSDGQWIWLNQWGWTWVDNQPWGFAPFHYGRWAFIGSTWAWVPGPVDVEALYAPALVVFIETGGDNIAWFPLGPGEIYVPAYAVSRSYFNRLNISNTYFHNININNWYKKINPQFNYKNMHIGNAITGVNKNTFTHAQPVNKAAIKFTQPMLLKARTHPYAPIAPTAQSILGGTLTKGVKPPKEVINQQTIIKNQSPAQPVSFTKVKDKLINNPGIPLNNQKLTTPGPTTMNPLPSNKQIKENQQIQGPFNHPTPIPVPQQEKLKPLKPQPAPVQQPVIKHENIQQPQYQSAPVQQPVIKHENIQQPQYQQAPVQQPVIKHENIQQPQYQQAPVQQPVIKHENIHQPQYQQAPVQQPVIKHENIHQPQHQQAPVQQPVIKHEKIQ